MQQSMTGFGNDECESGNFIIRTEVKALNSKFLDISCKLPRELTDKEAEIKNLIGKNLKRGKVMITVELDIKEKSTTTHVNEALFLAYYKTFKSLESQVEKPADNLFELALNAPEVLQTSERTSESIPWEEIVASLSSSISKCVNFRKEEGSLLSNNLIEYIDSIHKNLKNMEPLDINRISKIRGRLKEHLKELKNDHIDANRYEQEIIYYLEKWDVSEEKVRLKKHLEYFLEIIQNEAQAGKKLGFISQEIGREINTIGSKANDAAVQRYVVQMKDELEKIKEQLLNIL